MTRISNVAGWLVFALAGVAAGQDASELARYAGTWRRIKAEDGSESGLYRLEVEGETLQGPRLDAPEGLECHVEFRAESGDFNGTATWVEVDFDISVATAWEFTPESTDTMTGRAEWAIWELDGSVSERGWDDYRLERVPRIGLVTRGQAAAPTGSVPGDLSALAGTYRALGEEWSAAVEGGELVVRGTSATLTLRKQGSLLLGSAALNGGQTVEVELVADAGALAGRVEWRDASWLGSNAERGWGSLRLEPAQRIGLVTDGQSEAPFGDPIDDLAGLAGGWEGLGGAWRVEVEGDALVLTPVGHRDGVVVRVTDDRGTLRGEAELPQSETCRVELAWSGDALVGRSEWREGARSGWGEVEFTRLERVGDTEAPAPQLSGTLPESGVFKAEDGTFLRVQQRDGSLQASWTDAQGVSVAPVTGRAEADRWILEVQVGGVQTAEFRRGGVQLRWEVCASGDDLDVVAEWADLRAGSAIARGTCGRHLQRLQRLN